MNINVTVILIDKNYNLSLKCILFKLKSKYYKKYRTQTFIKELALYTHFVLKMFV